MSMLWGLLLFAVCFCPSLPAEALCEGKGVSASSLHQSFINNRCFVLNGAVDVQLDNDIRVTGDRVTLDTASSAMLGKKVTVHTPYGALYADRAYRKNDGSWHLRNARYSGCDAAQPHWALAASSVRYKDNWLSCISPTFRLAGKPLFWLPFFSVPLHKQWRGTSLLPHISYSGRHGFCMKQDIAYAWSSATRLHAGIDWRSRRGLGGTIAFQSPVLQGEYWRQGNEKAWLQGNAQLGIGDHFMLAGTCALGNDVRITKDLFADVASYNNYTQNGIGCAWQSELLRVAAHTGIEVDEVARVTALGPIRGLGDEYLTRTNRHVCLTLLQVESETVLPASWPVDGSWRMGGGLHFAYPSEASIYGQSASGFLTRYWHSVTVGQTWANEWATLAWRLEPWSQLRHDVGKKEGFLIGLNGRGTVQSMPLRWGTARVTPELTYRFWAGSQPLTFFDYQDMTARAQVVTPRLSLNRGSLSVTFEQPLVLHGRDQLPFALAYEGASPVLPAAVTFNLAAEQAQLRLTQHFDWQHMRFGMNKLKGSITHDRFQIEAQLAHHAPWYARHKQLQTTGGLFVSSGIKWYSSRHLCWWLRSKTRYDSLTSSWRALHHDVGIEYTGHCWALRAGYRQHLNQVFDGGRNEHSWYLRFRFVPLGSLGLSVKK